MRRRDIEEITLYDLIKHQPLNTSEFEALSSLPRLKRLNLRVCKADEGATSPLARCKGLSHLRGMYIKLSSVVLRAIGGRLDLFSVDRDWKD
jgi:hypothetical protein